MMDKNERNEHFKGFARLTLQKLMNKYDHLPPGKWGPAESDEIIIAQCAYDLAYHFIESSYEHKGTFRGEIHQTVKMLPDLTEWPNPPQP